MKLRTTFLMRCLAFAMALVLVITGSGLGQALQVFAVTDDRTVLSVNVGALVADNYRNELSDAEEALLNSGLLNAETIHYTAPGNDDGLIVIDEENKQVTAASYNDGHGHTWVPVTAYIKVGDEVKETLTVENGECAYTYGGNAFSVEVEYALNVVVSDEVQQTLLNTGAWLKDGVAQTGNVAAQYGFVAAVQTAMPELVELADTNIDLELNGTVIDSVGLNQDTKDAIYALNEEMAANNGELKLTTEINKYDNLAKTYYVMDSGLTMEAEAEALAEKIALIDADLADLLDALDRYSDINLVDAETIEKVQLLQKMTAELSVALANVKDQTWTAAEKGTALVAETVDYAALDELVAALGEQSVVEVNETLNVAVTNLQQNLAMFNVTVNVVLNVTEDAVGSDKLVEYGYSTITLTLLKDATAEDILASINSSGIEADALAGWAEEGVYVAEHFTAAATELPETLTEDITYTVTYAPVNYTVTLGYGDAMTVPYGYKYMLPVHADAAKSYDYVVNGENKAQGAVITIVGATEITRTEGKAYTATTLYDVVADNYGDTIAKAILKSGALNGNTVINVRKPDPTDAGSLLKLEDGKLTASNYAASYMGLEWVPYTYGVNGTENAFSGNEASWGVKSAKVQYRLNLTNFADQVDAALALAATLKNEADAQKSTLDSFAENYDTMGMLDKTKLGALNGVIGVTDFTPDDGTDTDAKNQELRAYFAEVVGSMINNNLSSNNYLKIYNMLGEYNTDGLRYYYNNAAELIAEIDSLSGYLTKLLAEEEALKIMVSAAGFPEYAEKITDLEGSLATVKANLTAPNAAIDLNSENLGKLLTALTTVGKVVIKTTGTPYLESDILMVTDSSQVYVQVIINTPNGSATVQTAAVDKGTVLSQTVIDALKSGIDAEVAKLLGENVSFYTLNVDGTAVNDLVGEALNEITNITYTYSVKNYTVKIEGEADQTVHINDLEINLPKHPTAGWYYEYTVDGEVTTASTYTFTTEQVERLFVGGTYTITRVEINENQEKLEESFEDWLSLGADGKYDLNAKVDANKDSVMGFAMTIIESGYTYIALNGEPLMYMVKDEKDIESLEICLQTLVNAILNDNTFGTDTLINLGKNGKGKLLAATMSVGNSADDLHYEDMDFVLELTSVPAQMGTVANGLETIKPYMTFNSLDGIMNVDITLPEKAYEAYLAGLLVTGNLVKENMEEINSEIAFQFLWDYVDLIINTDADTTTYTNTLQMLGIDRDLTGYEKYYQLVKKALKNEGVVVNPEDDNEAVDVSITGKGQKGIDALINLLGIDISAYETYLGMIKEYKDANEKLTASAVANLTNAAADFEAAVVDVSASGITNKADFTKNLPERIAQIAGKGAVILVGDVEGDLVVNGTVILDLNGFEVKGNIVSNGNLYIVDSSLDSANCGHVTGTVSGNVTIIAGEYDADVSAFVKDGYKQVDGAVVNALYSIESDGNTVTFVINTDVMDDASVSGYVPNARALAVDIVVDLVLNYYTAAALTVDDAELYKISIDDLVALIAGTNRIDQAIQKVLDCVDVPGISDFANVVLADLLDFGALAAALENDDVIASYDLTTAPWAVTVKHVTDGDYITADICTNADLAKDFTVALKLAGNNSDVVVPLLKEMADHVVVSAILDLEQPTYDGTKNYLRVNGTATVDATLKFRTDDYRTIVAVILAYGNAEHKDALITALNTGKQAPLKAAIDELTVEDVFDALKALNRATTFAEMAEQVGVEIDLGDAAKIENLYHIFLVAAGKGLEVLEITGRDTKLGNLDKDGDGIYEWTKTVTRNPDASVRSYTVYAEASATVTLTVELFAECEHDNTVTKIENVVEPTCTTAGSHDEVVYCADCGVELSRTHVTDPALGHEWSDWVVAEEPTCHTVGKETRWCNVCHSGESRTIPMVDHNWTEWEVTTPATCTEAGEETRYCQFEGCDRVETNVIPATGHVEGEVVIENEVPASCGVEGSYDKVVYCDVCGEELSRETITEPALEHDWSDWYTVVEANEDHGGVEERVCSICGEKETRETPKLVVPPTGDEFQIGLYIGLMALSLAGIAVLAWFVIAMKKTGRYSSK